MTFHHPETLLQSLGVLQPGMQVADFGCGPGYFVIALAKLVGENGKVFAVDVLQSALDAARHRAEKFALSNISFIRADLEQLGATGIADGSVGCVVLATTLFQSEKKSDILKEAKRILQSGGFCVIIEWNPHAALATGAHKISREDLLTLLEKEGFSLEKEFPVDAYHYGLLLHT